MILLKIIDSISQNIFIINFIRRTAILSNQ